METRSWIILGLTLLLLNEFGHGILLATELKDEKKRRQDEANAAESSRTILKQQLVTVQQRLTDTKFWCTELQSSLDRVKNDRMNFQWQVQSLENNLDQLQDQYCRYQTEKQADIAQLGKTLEAKSRELKEMRLVLSKADFKHLELEKQLNKVHAERTALQSQVQKSKDLLKQNSALTKDISDLQYRYQSANAKATELTAQVQQINSDNEQYRQKAEQWKRDLDIVSKRLAALRQVESANEQLKKQVAATSLRNAELEQQTDILERKNQIAKMNNRVLESSLGEVTLRTQDLESSLQAATQHCETLKTFSSMECVVCLTLQKNILFRPCMHLCVCEECSPTIKRCPLCCALLTNKEKVFV